MSAEIESWKAEETSNLVGSDRKISVTGTVQTSNTSQEITLVEGLPGLNEAILLLDLKVDSGIGGAVMGARTVTFEKPVTPNQYSQVTIRRAGGTEVTIDVQVIHS